MPVRINRRRALALLAAPAMLVAPAAWAQSLDFITFGTAGSTVTTVTGIRDRNMTGNYSLAGGATGGLLYTLPSLIPAPYPISTPSGVNFPLNATTATPYGPSFGSASGILRVAGSYKTGSSGLASPNFGYLFDGAAAPGQQVTTLVGDPTAFNTIAHSNFGNQVVGNWDIANLAPGNAFLYNIATGSMTTINRPVGASPTGFAFSTTAYGVYGNHIAGGSTDLRDGPVRAYILNQGTGLYTLYDAPNTGSGPGPVVTHFEGITGGGRANTFNLVADSVDSNGVHAWAVHVDAAGVATWTELKVLPHGSVTSGNSIYGSTAIGVYTVTDPTTGATTTYSYIVDVPGIYNPITNNTTLSSAVAGAVALSGIEGDDIVNNGTVAMSGAGSVGINVNTYGVVTNNGTVGVTGPSSAGVQLSGAFSSLLNYGTINAVSGSVAVLADATASGTIVVNYGTINGQVMVNAGPYVRFENSGWMGISAAGAGVVHQVSGTFAQTSAGTLSLRVAPNGVSDQLLVNGVARLAGTAQAVFQPGTYSRSDYTLLTATGGLTGGFDTLSTVNLPAFLSASLGYGATTVTLSLQSSIASLPGLGTSQSSVAQALDGAFNSGPGLNAVAGLYGLSAAEIGHALTVLSGSNASVGQSASLAAGGQFATLLASRGAAHRAAGGTQTAQQAEAPSAPLAEACVTEACDAAATANWSAWGAAFGGAQWLNADAGIGSPAAQQSIGGGAFGLDVRLGPQTLVGVALGLSDSSYWVGATGANGRATGFHAGLYGQQDWQGFYLSAALSYSRFDGTATRPIAGIGTTETARSSVIASQLGGRVEIGRAFEIAPPDGGRLAVTPFVALQPMQLWTPAYGESSVAATGAPGVFALNYQAQSTTSLPLFLGAQFDTDTTVQGRPLSAWVRAAWVHEFLPDRNVSAGFQVLPGTSFTVDGAKAAYNAARVDIGAKYDLGSQTSLFLNGSAELSDRGQAIGGTGGLRITF